MDMKEKGNIFKCGLYRTKEVKNMARTFLSNGLQMHYGNLVTAET